MALSNAWGLLLIIIFLSYGVIEVPRVLWRKANLRRELKFMEFRTAVIHDRMFEANAKLDAAVRLIHAAAKTVPNSSPLRPYIDVLVSKCPPKLFETHNALKTHENAATLSDLGEVKMKKLVSLHHDLKFALVAERTFDWEWEQHLSAVFYMQDLVAAQEAGTWLIDSELRHRSKCCCMRVIYAVEYCWKAHMVRWFYTLGAVVTVLASVLLVLGETLLFIDEPVTGVPLLFSSDHGFVGTQLLCLIPLLYVILCTEIGLFQIKFSVSKSLFHRHSETSSLIWTSAFLARLITPLGFNFLKLIKVTDTQYSDVMGALNLVPLLGEEFSIYFPALIIPFCLANYLKLYSRLMAWIRLQQFTFTDRFEEEKALEGLELLVNGEMYLERKARERAEPMPIVPGAHTDRFTDVFAEETPIPAGQIIAESASSNSLPKLRAKYQVS
jgi:hypothetical protein